MVGGRVAVRVIVLCVGIGWGGWGERGGTWLVVVHWGSIALMVIGEGLDGWEWLSGWVVGWPMGDDEGSCGYRRSVSLLPLLSCRWPYRPVL